MTAILALSTSVLFSVVAQLLLKKVLGSVGHIDFGSSVVASYLSIFLSPIFLIGAVVYLGSILLWMFVLSRVQLSIAYPIFVSASVVLTALGALIFFREQISLVRWCGIGIIGFGIYLVAGL